MYGARPLKRAIQKFLLTPLSTDILAGKIKDGARIRILPNVDRTNIEFTVVEQPPQETSPATKPHIPATEKPEAKLQPPKQTEQKTTKRTRAAAA